MINNINTLQTNLTESSKLTTYTDEYLRESLANLGQRFSVKGDGVSLSEFTISDLFNNSDVNKDINNAYACINISYNTSSNSYDVKLLCDNTVVYLESYNNIYQTGSYILLPGSPINNVNWYKNNGYIQKLDDEYRTAFTGYAGNINNANDKNIIETTINNFAIQAIQKDIDFSKTLLNGLRFFVSTSDNKIKAINCSLQNFYTEFENSNLESENNSYYNFVVYDTIFDSLNILDEIIDNEIIDLDVNNIVNKLIKENYLKVHTFKKINNGTEEVKECKFFTECINGGNGQLTFDLTKIDNLANDNLINELNKVDPKLKEDIVNISIMFTYDVAEFLPLAEKVYNEGMFGDSENLKLKKKLVAQIAKKIFEDYKKDCNEFVKDITGQTLNVLSETLPEFNIYLPLNYKFVYSCNSNNQWQIYNSIDDINVEYTATINEEINKILRNNPEQLMICDVPDLLSIDNKFNVYSFGITYTTESLVDDINVFKKFTLPYIDQNGYWSINDISTSVYARGRDGGQPCIIISYSYISNNYISTEILSSFKNDELKQLAFEPAYIKIKPIDDYNNAYAFNYHILKTSMPVNIESLDDNFITFLEHALILNIISTNCEDTTLSTARIPLSYNLGSNSVIPTFWALNKNLNEDTKKYEYYFAYIKQPNMDWAVDMNYLSNADSLIKYYMTNFGINPDEYEHSWLVFDKISTSFKNSDKDSNYDGSVWPVIMNKQADYYSNTIGSTENINTQYENNLNINIGFFNDIKKQQGTSYIIGVNHNSYNHYFSIYKSTAEDGKNTISRVTHYAYYPKEYIPNAKFGSSSNEDTYTYNGSSYNENNYDLMIPTLDLAEVFVRNQTTINRHNILSVDESGCIYNAYIGTSYDSDNKSILHIGTSSTNPNIGEITLMSHEDKSYFNKMSQIDIDFDNIYLNGNVVTNGSEWTPFYDESGSGKKAWHMTTRVGAIVNEIMNVPLRISFNKHYYMSDKLFFKTIDTILSEITLPNNDKINLNARNIYYLNLNKFFTEVAKVQGATRYSDFNQNIFVGENVIMMIDKLGIEVIPKPPRACHYLRLQTDLDESYIPVSLNNNYKYVLTNPIEFAYTIDDGKMIVTVREIVTDKSIPDIYANELL